MSKEPRRIVGIAADVDDENVVPGPAMSVYHPFEQEIGGGRLFVHAAGDPYALVSPITRIIREIEPEQPVERPATLDDVRAEVLAPNRLNALVFGGFAGVALTIAVVGVAGVLAFSVSARTREFGIRLAMGSTPRHLMTRVLREGAVIAGIGIVAGAVVGGALVWVVGRFFVGGVDTPGALPVAAAAAVLVVAAVLASLMPASRAVARRRHRDVARRLVGGQRPARSFSASATSGAIPARPRQLERPIDLAARALDVARWTVERQG